jgi:hypothetical protein
LKSLIYREIRRGNLINDKYTVSNKKSFEGALNRVFACLVHFFIGPPHNQYATSQ